MNIPSEADDRTANNAVRHQYRVLTDAEKQHMVELKDLGAAFIEKCREVDRKTPMRDTTRISRELSIAITKAEEAVMWAVKHVTK